MLIKLSWSKTELPRAYETKLFLLLSSLISLSAEHVVKNELLN